jgi:hypothetical protein
MDPVSEHHTVGSAQSFQAYTLPMNDQPPAPAPSLDAHALTTLVSEYRRLKALGERALAQVPSDEGFNRMLDPESNSLVTLVRHLAGNMRSRWIDFLTTDGEKPTRNRDGEFNQEMQLTRDEVLAEWENGWSATFNALNALTPSDLLRTVKVRDEPLTVFEAIARQLGHYAQHVGQILFLAKHIVGPGWQTLSIPRGHSKEQWSYRQYGR